MPKRMRAADEAPPESLQPNRYTFVAASTFGGSRSRSQLPIVTPGEPIPAEPGFLRGHGTLVRRDGALIATVAGMVERVNKLVSVRPLRSSRYVGEVGDVVVGRILEVGQKRWKVDVGGRQEAILMLSSINLPGGEQRRRTAEDQLNMRQFYVEHDLVSAEIQAFFQDGSMSLHTRSLMYGKLSNGVLVADADVDEASATSTHRLWCPRHFGMNGFVWVSARKLLHHSRGRGGKAATLPAQQWKERARRRRPKRAARPRGYERVCRARTASRPLTSRALSRPTVCRFTTPRLCGHSLKAMLPDVQQAICAAAHLMRLWTTHGARGATADEDE